MNYNFAEGFYRARINKYKTQEQFVNAYNNFYNLQKNKDNLQKSKEHYLTTDTVSSWERGKNMPRGETLIKLCEFFNCDMDYLFNGTEFINKDIQYIHNYIGLSTQAIEQLHEMNNVINLFPKLNHDFKFFDRITFNVYNDLIVDGSLWQLIVDLFNMRIAENDDKYLGFSTRELQEAITAKRFQEIVSKYIDKAVNEITSNETDNKSKSSKRKKGGNKNSKHN